MAELDESWNTFLTGLEDLGVDGLPADMEIDLRHVMNLESPSLRLLEPDELDDDLLEPFGFFPMDSEELRKAAEPFMLLPDRLSLNSEPSLEEPKVQEILPPKYLLSAIELFTNFSNFEFCVR